MKTAMRQAEAIPSMRVQVPDEGHVQGRAGKVWHRTFLFRGTTCLPETLKFAVERAPDKSGLAAAIVACSTGAEADSLLVLYNGSGRGGKVTLTGYDASHTAIEAARKGLHKLHRPSFDEEGRSLEEKALRSMGFATSYEPNGHDLLKCSIVTADAAPVRRGHSVRFVEHDATNPVPTDGEVDLAIASNLLYQLDAEKSIRIASNMADILADRGVLSLGSVGGRYFENETKEPMEAMLRDDYDLEPSTTGTEDLMIYARE